MDQVAGSEEVETHLAVGFGLNKKKDTWFFDSMKSANLRVVS